MGLQDLFVWVGSESIALTIAYQIIERWPWAVALEKWPRQLVSFAIAASLGILAWVGRYAYGMYPNPGTVLAWVDALVAAGMTAIALSQAGYGIKVLRKK